VRTEKLLLYGGLAALAYYLWTKASGAVGSAISSATAPLANAYVGLTSGPSAQSLLQGQIAMPDGSTLPLSSISSGTTWIGNTLTFVSPVDGNTYSLSPQSGGTYSAMPY